LRVNAKKNGIRKKTGDAGGCEKGRFRDAKSKMLSKRKRNRLTCVQTTEIQNEQQEEGRWKNCCWGGLVHEGREERVVL